MPERSLREVLVVGALLTAVAISPWLPRVEKRAAASRVGLVRALPEKVGEWERLEPRYTAVADGANELVEAPYVHPDGTVLQLTLEYGSDQRRAHELHYPHTCHRVRGDVIVLLPRAPLRVDPTLTLPTFSFHWRQSATASAAYCRFWLVEEGSPTVDIAALKLRQLANGLVGRSTSAVLVRMDVPRTEPLTAADDARLQGMTARFAVALYRALAPEERRLLFGDAAVTRVQSHASTMVRGVMNARTSPRGYRCDKA